MPRHLKSNYFNFNVFRHLSQLVKELTRPASKKRPDLSSVKLTYDLLRLCGSSGGASRDRTDDPLLAKQVLSQLSYGPLTGLFRARRRCTPCSAGHVPRYTPVFARCAPCLTQKIRRHGLA